MFKLWMQENKFLEWNTLTILAMKHLAATVRSVGKGYYAMSGTSQKNSKIQQLKRKILV